MIMQEYKHMRPASEVRRERQRKQMIREKAIGFGALGLAAVLVLLVVRYADVIDNLFELACAS